MHWQIPATVTPPLPARSLRPARFQATLQLPHPVLQVYAPPLPGDDNAATADPIRQRLQALGLDSEIAGGSAVRLPPPWRDLSVVSDPAALAQARTLELACALQILPPPRPEARSDAHAELIAMSDLDRRVYEGVGMALFDPGANWDRRNNLLMDWQHAVRTVLHERSGPAPARRGNLPLLSTGFDLLNLVTKLRTRQLDDVLPEQYWQAFLDNSDEPPPLVFALVYWSEVVYRLSEQGDTETARRYLSCLESLSEQLLALLSGIGEDLHSGMWWHHRGRLAYYQGDFVTALNLFATEWHFRNRLDSTRQARLMRNTASVLNDMGYLALAERLTRDALQEQEQSADYERFKTWGRLGEILLRLGRIEEARAACQRSWEIQQETEQDGRTPVYLGHVALLAGDNAAAELWYTEAEQLDQQRPTSFNPYLWMGRSALALRCNDRQGLTDIWEIYREEIEQLRGDRVLPAAVITTALYRAECCDIGLLQNAIHGLLTEHYIIEALHALPLAYPSPCAATALLEKICDTLGDWRDAYQRFCAQTGVVDEPTEHPAAPNSEHLLAAIEACLQDDDWASLLPYRTHLFPMNLPG